MMEWKTLTASLLNFLYPNRCPCCDDFIQASCRICDQCARETALSPDDYCHFCGKIPCRCKKHKWHYDRAVVCSAYRDGAVKGILHLKTSTNQNFAYHAARVLASALQEDELAATIDCVVPVPMHRSKQRSRGYNQAALIGKEIARILDLPYREDLLFKEESDIEQHTLSAQERERHLEHFGIHPISLDGMRILLCDDVLTTGSTMNRCAALLKQQGASFVIAAAAATTASQ